jgi:DNA invertase Pin-like site-specific DNA recombinase
MTLYGYARVSTTNQETNLQLDALKRAGCFRIFQEKTGGLSKRPQLQFLLQKLKQGDTLVIYKFDRIGRSLSDLLRIVDAMAIRGIGVRSLTEPLDTSTAIGKLLFQQLGAFAEFERNLIRERSIAGQKAAIKRGAIVGRPSVLSTHEKKEVRDLYSNGWWTMAALAIVFEVHPSVIKRAIYQGDVKSN